MKDIDELIKELRLPCPHENCILCQDAAAVIASLSSILKLLGDESSYQGLKEKYIVLKKSSGEIVDNCFVLRPDKDTSAVAALRAYAADTDNKQLSEDIYSWVGRKD